MSVPNGDTRLMRGHFNEKFVEVKRKDEDGNEFVEQVPLRTYLAKRNRLVTGKTK